MGWGRRRFSEAWMLLFAGLCILALVAVDVAYFAVHPGGPRRPAAVTARYPLPAVTGALRLQDPVYSWRTVSPIGGRCKGLGVNDGILGGTQVVVEDPSGAVIATGALDIGKVVDGSMCEFAFVVQGVPKADAYQFEILNRSVGTFRYDDVVGRGWNVTLSR
jgi:hypothetical protein